MECSSGGVAKHSAIQFCRTTLHLPSSVLQAFTVSTAIVLINALISGASPNTAFPYDDLFLLDGVWRVVQGQHEGVDFYNPIGFGLFHVGAVIWEMFGPHRWILAITSAVFSEVIVICAAIVVPRRPSFSTRDTVLVCAVIAFEASAPAVDGWPIVALGMGAFYNRLTVAALAVLSIQWLAKPSDESKWPILEVFACATLLNILFLVKVSAFGLAFAILGGALIIRPYRIPVRNLCLFGLSFSMLLISDFVLTGTSLSGLVRDYQEAAEVRRGLAAWDAVLRISASRTAFLFAALLTIYGLSMPRNYPSWKIGALVTLCLGLQLSLNVSNTQPATVFMMVVCAAILLAWRQPGLQLERRSRIWKSVPLIAFLAVLITEGTSTLEGFVLWVGEQLGLVTPVVISAGSGVSLPVVHMVIDAEHTTKFARSVNKGIQLLKVSGLTNVRIASLDYVNPFPLLLRSPSPKGVPVVWAMGYMEPNRPLTVKELVGDACVVMVPKQPTRVVEGSAEFVARASTPILSASFSLYAENEFWTAYRRKDDCAVEINSLRSGEG